MLSTGDGKLFTRVISTVGVRSGTFGKGPQSSAVAATAKSSMPIVKSRCVEFIPARFECFFYHHFLRLVDLKPVIPWLFDLSLKSALRRYGERGLTTASGIEIVLLF
jgi:hypothetical protein